MSFLSKVGNILKQSVRQSVASEMSHVKFSAFQALRCMCSLASGPKIFLGGLSYQMDENTLRDACSKYGQVIDARVVMDRETGRSRGFGFVTFASSEEASSAIQALDGQDLHGRVVRVNYASDRRGSGGGYGGGGYGGGGYGGGGYGGSGGYSGGGGYGGGGGYSGGGGYGGGGDGGNFGGGGSSNYGSSGNYNSNYGGNAATTGGDFGSVAGGAGGSDNFSSSFGGGYDGNSSSGFGGNDGADNNFGSGNGNGPREGNFNDDDDTDYAKRA